MSDENIELKRLKELEQYLAYKMDEPLERMFILRKIQPAITALERQREGCPWCDRAWSIKSSIEKLTTAAGILLFDHDYDGHGYEEMQIAMKTVIDWLAEQDQLAAAEQSKSETDRERFEDWISVRRLRSVERVPPGVSGAGMYYDPEVALAWEAWQEAQTMSRDSMDREVAEKVMGYHFHKYPVSDGGSYQYRDEQGRRGTRYGFSPSTRIDHLWEALMALAPTSVEFFETEDGYGCEIEARRSKHQLARGEGETFLVAGCRAALEAVKPQ